ncbi:MAG: flagellar brake protein [Thioalkalispiraceae bacterium]|jgi:c-di-GMP-binding flagellar brake protein YcgR
MLSTEQDKPQTIIYKPYMAGLLKRLQSERAQISISIDQDNTIYNTIIIDVQAKQQHLYLDELNSEKAHKRIRKGSQIHFDGRIKGVRINFTTRVLAIEDNNHIAMYRLGLPDEMVYRQRRRYYRASVHNHRLGISIPVPLKHRINGSIIDISAGGFCSRLDLSETSVIQEQQTIFDAMISLPGQNTITCDIEIRSIRHYPEHGYSLVGSEFKAIEPDQQTHVERVVAMLDRDQRRTAGV